MESATSPTSAAPPRRLAPVGLGAALDVAARLRLTHYPPADKVHQFISSSV
jgi:hypothetical protein